MRITRISRAPRVDGRLDDAVWGKASFASDFRQQRPKPDSAASELTEVAFVYDDEAIYVAARMHRKNPGDIERSMTRRDAQGNAERVGVIFDPQQDRRTAVGFHLSAAGVRTDFRLTQDSEMSGRENQFDPVWTAATTIDSTGWSAEMRIPFSQLRFPPRDVQRWGVQVDRWMPDKNETVKWIVVAANETGYISRFGTLEGLSGLPRTRPVEFVPYLAGDATRRGSTTTTNPLDQPFAGRMGADAKFAIGSNLTLDATVNPDFGQVEADPAEVNLSAFETFFDERRPFFVEGAEMLRGSGSGYFYPRRIGAAPHLTASADFVDTPRSSTILGATKLTGRLPSRLSIGALAAVTAREDARTFDVSDSLRGATQVEPRTAYGLLRLQQEIGKQASTVGLALTTTQRTFGGSAPLQNLLARDSYYAGLDWRLRFQQGKYALSGFVAASHVAGDTGAIRRLQTASTRFFQRPDREQVIFDPTKRSLSGYSAQFRADKDAGKRYLWGAEVKLESPGYDVNDLGRLASTDDIEYNADLQIRDNIPGTRLQGWQLGFETRGALNFEGIQQQNSFTQNSSVTFMNFWQVNVRSSIALAAIDDALTRGGPLMGKPRDFAQEFRLNGPSGARTGWRINYRYDFDEFDAVRQGFGGQLTLRPSARVTVSAEPNYNWGVDPRQYVARVAGGTRTYGARYLFAAIDRRTISTRFRLNYSFTPNLTVEGYGEPFLSSGEYSGFGELSAPRSRALRVYGTDGTTVTTDTTGRRTITDDGQTFTISNRDFHVLSFRSNMVMRWEWVPGSTLFLVWQQNRRTDDPFGGTVRLRELLNTTRAVGDNFLSVKVSYWLPVRLGGGRTPRAVSGNGEDAQ
ncbi:MAG: DUF5916 domain-containing protein [Gemmatimonadota bacterium]